MTQKKRNIKKNRVVLAVNVVNVNNSCECSGCGAHVIHHVKISNPPLPRAPLGNHFNVGCFWIWEHLGSFNNSLKKARFEELLAENFASCIKLPCFLFYPWQVNLISFGDCLGSETSSIHVETLAGHLVVLNSIHIGFGQLNFMTKNPICVAMTTYQALRDLLIGN